MNKKIFYEKFVKPFEQYELEASKRISDKFKVDILNLFDYENNRNKYDFVDSNGFKYEVKYDKVSNLTGKFYIEFISYGKSSGIDATKADYYIITDGIIYYLIDVLTLKDICKACNNYKYTKDGTTCGYSIKKNLIIEQSITI